MQVSRGVQGRGPRDDVRGGWDRDPGNGVRAGSRAVSAAKDPIGSGNARSLRERDTKRPVNTCQEDAREDGDGKEAGGRDIPGKERARCRPGEGDSEERWCRPS